jgi:hypothetical protein
LRSAVFKTAAFNRSATSPQGNRNGSKLALARAVVGSGGSGPPGGSAAVNVAGHDEAQWAVCSGERRPPFRGGVTAPRFWHTLAIALIVTY